MRTINQNQQKKIGERGYWNTDVFFIMGLKLPLERDPSYRFGKVELISQLLILFPSYILAQLPAAIYLCNTTCLIRVLYMHVTDIISSNAPMTNFNVAQPPLVQRDTFLFWYTYHRRLSLIVFYIFNKVTY